MGGSAVRVDFEAVAERWLIPLASRSLFHVIEMS